MESAELVALLHEVRDRVRSRNPETGGGDAKVALPDLMPLAQARDAALGKVAAIGTVNPRSGGPINSLVQAWKRLVARVLDWHVREQVEFNRKSVACIDAAIESMNDFNRALVSLGARISAQENIGLTDIRNHWAEWRFEWENKLTQNEVQFLRSVADLQAGYQHRGDLMDANYRDVVRAQHRDFEGALERFTTDIQKRLWADLERIRLEYERLIHSELKTIRQRAQITAASARTVETVVTAAPSASTDDLGFDYGRFAERFRGTEEYVKAGQKLYLPLFAGLENVLDIGCGRGEFLEAVPGAKGIDLSEESIAICRHKGLEAEVADLFVYLENLAESSLDGIFCSQVVEHIPAERLPGMIKLCASRLRRGGVIAIETPNPECLAIFATHFYLDPTHQRPVPHPLLAFYFEEFGIGNIEVHKISPAVESMPSLKSLPEDFREAFFGGLDYGITGKKL
ncbi:MAG TPA: class I SAM-dependent methyltransferase [Candidatus Acidoferrum sp.]|nr:class I SAM-dependent methyltransferase [Candidatus Acidoferrum sp.]